MKKIKKYYVIQNGSHSPVVASKMKRGGQEGEEFFSVAVNDYTAIFITSFKIDEVKVLSEFEVEE